MARPDRQHPSVAVAGFPWSPTSATGAKGPQDVRRLYGPMVTPTLDAGPIIAQAVVPILEGVTDDELSARILKAELRLYPLVIDYLAI